MVEDPQCNPVSVEGLAFSIKIRTQSTQPNKKREMIEKEAI